MSAIVYIGPEKSHGTKFYMEDEFEIENDSLTLALGKDISGKS